MGWNTKLVVCACVGVGVLAGCVTERVSPPRPVRTTHAPSPDRTSEMPQGPVASPAREARTVNAIMRAAITPLGTVPFDGQVLPMVSPDGRYAATQVGQAPTWSALLVEPEAPASVRTGVEVYDITQSPPRLVRGAASLPAGTMLGRSCDADVFLVEHIGATGARRVGKVSWESGDVVWVDDAGTGALLAGGIVTTTPGQELRAPWGEVSEPETELWFPVTSGAPDVVYCFAETSRGLELQAWARSVRATSDGMDADAAMSLIARRRIAPVAERIVAYQAVDPVRGWVEDDSPESPPGLLFFNPGTRRMSVFDPNTGDLVALAPESIGGAWTRDPAGWGVLLSTPDGLVYQRLEESRGVWSASPAARLLGDPYVPRATNDAARPCILIGPARDPRRVNLMALQLMPSDLTGE